MLGDRVPAKGCPERLAETYKGGETQEPESLQLVGFQTLQVHYETSEHKEHGKTGADCNELQFYVRPQHQMRGASFNGTP